MAQKLVVGQEYTSEMLRWKNGFPFGFAVNPVDPKLGDILIHHDEVKNVNGYVRLTKGKVRYTLRQRKTGYYGENVHVVN